jgi:hypothetical protein
MIEQHRERSTCKPSLDFAVKSGRRADSNDKLEEKMNMRREDNQTRGKDSKNVTMDMQVRPYRISREGPKIVSCVSNPNTQPL